MILNLKELNKFIVYRHFKMDSLKTVTDLMTQGCSMASIDMKDAYYTVSIATEHQIFLKFRWRDNLYQYTCLPNRLASAPPIFIKLLKPVFNILREKGYLSSSYIEDCYLQGATYGESHDNVQETVMLFGDLGFPIHNEKSVHAYLWCQVSKHCFNISRDFYSLFYHFLVVHQMTSSLN